MQHIRLNQAIKWYQKDDKLFLFLGNQKISLPSDLGLAELFAEMLFSTKEFTRERLRGEYKLSDRVCELLIQLGVFITLNNCAGPEARAFHSLVENPSHAYLLEQQDELFIASLYKNLETFFYASLGGGRNQNILHLGTENIPVLTLQPTHSTRKKLGNSDTSRKNEILQMVAILCSSEDHTHYYGSGGGLYSIYSVLVFRSDEVYLFDRYKGCFYQHQVFGIYQEICSTFISTQQNYFDAYECYVIFLSAYEATLFKYSNRGYKYIQMEAGALATLLRQYAANVNMPQLEVQGYFDKPLMSILAKKLGINIEKTLLVHTMCLN